MRAGAEAFKKQFSLHYDGIVEKFGAKGCEIPLEFIERHCDSEDRKLFKEYLEPKIYEKWERSVSEPKTAPVGKKPLNRILRRVLLIKCFLRERKYAIWLTECL